MKSHKDTYDYLCRTCGEEFFSASREQEIHDEEWFGHEVQDGSYLQTDPDAPILYITEGWIGMPDDYLDEQLEFKFKK